MPRDTWKNNSSRGHPRAGINELEHHYELEREERKADRKAYYASIRNPRQYWAAVRRNRALENAKWADAMKRMTEVSNTPGLTVESLSGLQSGMDDAGAENERSEALAGAVEASRTPCQSEASHPAGAHAPVGDEQLTLF